MVLCYSVYLHVRCVASGAKNLTSSPFYHSSSSPRPSHVSYSHTASRNRKRMRLSACLSRLPVSPGAKRGKKTIGKKIKRVHASLAYPGIKKNSKRKKKAEIVAFEVKVVLHFFLSSLFFNVTSNPQLTSLFQVNWEKKQPTHSPAGQIKSEQVRGGRCEGVCEK